MTLKLLVFTRIVCTILQRIFHSFLHRRLERKFALFKFFFNTYLGYEHFTNIFAYLNLHGHGLFKNVYFAIFRALVGAYLC